MSESISHVYDGIGTPLLATYSSGTENVTSSYDCSEYSRIIVYVSTSDVTGSGIVSVYVDYSFDGTNFYIPYIVDPATGLAVAVNQKTPTTAQACKFDFPNAGKFFRVRIKYASGTSVIVTGVAVEGKS